MSQLCEMVANKRNAVLGYINRGIISLITGSNCSSSLCTDQGHSLLTVSSFRHHTLSKIQTNKTCSEKGDKDECGTRN